MKRLGLLIGIVTLGIGCDFEPVCAPLVYNRATELCECPMGAPYDPEAGGCVLGDGGVIPFGDGGATRDACVPAPETCNGIDDDCDGESDEAAASAACETVPGATQRACTAGQCVVIECAAGRDDCNDVYSDGCEAELATDDANCGGCGLACDAGESCEASACVELPILEWVTPVAPGASGSWIVDHSVGGDGSTCILGEFTGEFRFASRSVRAQRKGVFVARVGRAGALEWYALIDGPDEDGAFAVAAGPAGQCIVSAAVSAGAVTVGGREVNLATRQNVLATFSSANVSQLTWVQSLQAFEMVWDGASVVVAAFALNSLELDGLTVPQQGLLRFDASNLRLLLARAVPAMTIAIDSDGQIFAAGPLQSTTEVSGTSFSPRESDGDVLVSRWSPELALVTGWVIGRSSYDLPVDVALAGPGRVQVLGASYLDDGGTSEVAIWDVSAAETRVAILGRGGYGSSIIWDAREVWLVGPFSGSSAIGDIEFASRGGDDVLVAATDDRGTARWARVLGTTGNDYLRAQRGAGGSVIAAGYVGGRYPTPSGEIVPMGDRAALVMSMRLR